MVPYVKRNQNAYLKMRDIPLNNNTSPAVRFSVIEERSKTINFTFNSKEVLLPKNKIDIKKGSKKKLRLRC